MTFVALGMLRQVFLQLFTFHAGRFQSCALPCVKVYFK